MPNQKRKVLITGGQGTVGSYVNSIFSEDVIFSMSKSQLDITDKSDIHNVFKKIQPDIVIHLAALTNVDNCELQKDKALLTNTIATEYLANECNKNKVFMVYMSTGAVFSGKKKFYTENDKPDPLNEYGKTKLLGENKVKEILKDYIILRAGWVIGGGMKEKKFISYLINQIHEGKKEIFVVNDKYGTLTYANELAEYMKYLINTNQTGLFHFGSTGVCSRFEIAQEVVNFFGFDVKIIPISSAKFQTQFFAPRPKYEVLKSLKITKNFEKPWKDSLKNYLKKELQYAKKI